MLHLYIETWSESITINWWAFCYRQFEHVLLTKQKPIFCCLRSFSAVHNDTQENRHTDKQQYSYWKIQIFVKFNFLQLPSWRTDLTIFCTIIFRFEKRLGNNIDILNFYLSAVDNAINSIYERIDENQPRNIWIKKDIIFRMSISCYFSSVQ